MPTNPQAPGKTKVTFEITRSEKETLKHLAAASKLTMSKYCMRLIGEALDNSTIFAHHKTTTGTHLKVAEDNTPYDRRSGAEDPPLPADNTISRPRGA